MTGKNWKEFNHLTKCTYLIGIDNGLSWALTLISHKVDNKEYLEKTKSIIFGNILAEIDYDDLVKEVNEFYKLGPNLNIPVLFAFDYTKRRYLGETESELEELLSSWRKVFNK